jgi:hypothetical protein
MKKYFSSCASLVNMVVMPQGGATKRPPTVYVANAKNQSGANRPVRFVFSTVQAYILEFSNGNVRVYMNDGQVLSGLSPVDISVPYTSAELPALKFCQSADTLFIFHPAHPIGTLTRSSHTSWAYATPTFRDGPYLPVNTTATTLSPSAATGAITLTASAALFAASDVGRAVRLKLYSLWAWLLITVFTDSTHVTAVVQLGTQFGAADAIDGAAWAANKAYPTGAVVTNSSQKYIAVAGGISGATPGPTGTGTQILDGTVTWKMVGGFDSVAWGQHPL